MAQIFNHSCDFFPQTPSEFPSGCMNRGHQNRAAALQPGAPSRQRERESFSPDLFSILLLYAASQGKISYPASISYIHYS